MRIHRVTITLRKLLSRWLRKPQRNASVPPGCRIYAVGDIHGRSDLLDRLMRLIGADASGFKGQVILVFVGDYVDRGADSKGVIQRLLSLTGPYQAHFLRGNHDQVLLNFLDDPKSYDVWREFGGVETLLSYGVRPPLSNRMEELIDARNRFAIALPASHRAFLERLALSYTAGDYFFTHAGVRPRTPLDQQTPQDLMWIRQAFLVSTADFGKVVVHGHTPTRTPVSKFNRIGIDTGAYATGRLTAAVLEGRACRFLQTS